MCNQAKELCPEIKFAQVPSSRGKADLTRYREAGKEVANVLQKFSPLLERASVDEAYLDITDSVMERLAGVNVGEFELQPAQLLNTFAVGFDCMSDFLLSITTDSDNEEAFDGLDYDEDLSYMDLKISDIKLLIGATIVNEIRAAVKTETGYECSSGIAHNKILAKLTCGFNKPNKQTIMPLKGIPKLFSTLPVSKIKGFGGKLGVEICEKLKIKFMGDLFNIPEIELQKHLDEKNASWLYWMARGIDLERVTPKFASKSIGCCKRFPGRNAISKLETLNHWLNDIACEIYERLEKDFVENNRSPKQITISVTQKIGNEDVSKSRSIPFGIYDSTEIFKDSLDAVRKIIENQPLNSCFKNPITFLGISVGKFENHDKSKKQNHIIQLFTNFNKTSNNNNSSHSQNSNTHSGNDDKYQPIIGETRKSIQKIQPKNTIKSMLQNQSISSTRRDMHINQNANETTLEENLNECAPDMPAVCSKCDEKILEKDLLSHMDFHLAMELSKEERQQFREAISKKPQSVISNLNGNKNETSETNITKFVVPLSKHEMGSKIRITESENVKLEQENRKRRASSSSTASEPKKKMISIASYLNK